MIQILWMGHSCFKIVHEGHSLVIDPYASDWVPLPPLRLKAGVVYTSHGHGDHSFRQAVTIEEERGTRPFVVETMPTFHDKVRGGARGENDVHIIDVDGQRLVHLGDLGHLLDLEQLQRLGKVDVLMIPVSAGPVITLEDAMMTIDSIRPRIVVPMHYALADDYLPGFKGVEEFLALVADRRKSLGVDDVAQAEMSVEPNVKQGAVWYNTVLYSGNVLEVDASTQSHLAVLSYDVGNG